jgi:nucleoid-associated protein YgaU
VVEVAAVERQPGSYLVRSGDSLWSIAERLLPGASVTEVDAAWRRIHRANRRLIGPDPDLIIAGTALRLPPMTSGPHHLDGPGVLGAPHERKDAS